MQPEIIKIAQLLRTPPEVIEALSRKMEGITNREGVIKAISQDNDEKVRRSLEALNLGSTVKAEDVFIALIEKAKKDDRALADHFHQIDVLTETGCRSFFNSIGEITGNPSGFYLKEEKAKQLLKMNPPRHILAELGYGNDIDKMLEKENIFELFCGLRFAEDNRWLNDVFFDPYRELTKDDFEERQIKLMVLPEKWLGIGKKFLGQKLHHMSHLKELGIVFVIPVAKQAAGEMLYLFFMSLHYIYEVDWHSQLFRKYSKEDNFAAKMIGALKVEVGGQPLPDEGRIGWRIVPKYLAKTDTNDPRLFEPHISPEAWHFSKAASAIKKFSQRFPELGLDFWNGLGAVGGYFPDNSTEDILISFDLFDTGISLLRQSNFESKYLYHQQEALWNEIFVRYMGEEEMDRLMMENIERGYIVL